MSAPFPTVDPITRAQQWHKFTLRGKDSPGTIPKGGIKGFKRETGWDVKKGKGTQGATLTVKEVPPVEGEITVQLFTEQDFKDWDSFVQECLFIDATLQSTQGLPIYHPICASIALTDVVVKYFTPPEHQGKGLYHATIHFIEWSTPPAQSVVSTPSSAASDAPDGDTTPPVDPRIAARQREVALRTQAAKAP